MNNIFENAYFGKPYKTRDGRKAIYIESYENHSHLTVYRLMSEGPFGHRNVIIMQNGNVFSFRDDKDDIVSEWEEPINEEKLDDLAYDYNEERQPNYWWEDDCTVCVCEASEVRKAYKAGYRAAKRGE